MGNKWMPVALLFMTSLVVVPGGSAAAEKAKMAHRAKTIIVTPDDIQWKQGPAALPETKMAVLDGDPNKSGFFVIRLKLPAGTKIPPHVHDNVEKVTVISGKINLAMGDKQENPMALPAAGYFSLPPKTLHNAWVDEETILQISTMGPWTFKPLKKATEKKE